MIFQKKQTDSKPDERNLPEAQAKDIVPSGTFDDFGAMVREEIESEDLAFFKRRVKIEQNVLEKPESQEYLEYINVCKRNLWRDLPARLKNAKWMEEGKVYSSQNYTAEIMRTRGADLSYLFSKDPATGEVVFVRVDGAFGSDPRTILKSDGNIEVEGVNREQFPLAFVNEEAAAIDAYYTMLEDQGLHKKFDSTERTFRKLREQYGDAVEKFHELYLAYQSPDSKPQAGNESMHQGQNKTEGVESVKHDNDVEKFSLLDNEFGFSEDDRPRQDRLEVLYSRITTSNAERKIEIVEEMIQKGMYEREDFYSHLKLIDMGLRLLGSSYKGDQAAGRVLLDGLISYHSYAEKITPLSSKIAFQYATEYDNGEERISSVIPDMSRHLSQLPKTQEYLKYGNYVVDAIKACEPLQYDYNPNHLIVEIGDSPENGSEGYREAVDFYQGVCDQILQVKTSKKPAYDTAVLLTMIISQTDNPIGVSPLLQEKFTADYSIKDVLHAPNEDEARRMADELCKAIPKGDYLWKSLTDLLLGNNLNAVRKVYEQVVESPLPISQDSPVKKLESTGTTTLQENDNHALHERLQMLERRFSKEPYSELLENEDVRRRRIWINIPERFKTGKWMQDEEYYSKRYSEKRESMEPGSQQPFLFSNDKKTGQIRFSYKKKIDGELKLTETGFVGKDGRITIDGVNREPFPIAHRIEEAYLTEAYFRMLEDNGFITMPDTLKRAWELADRKSIQILSEYKKSHPEFNSEEFEESENSEEIAFNKAFVEKYNKMFESLSPEDREFLFEELQEVTSGLWEALPQELKTAEAWKKDEDQAFSFSADSLYKLYEPFSSFTTLNDPNLFGTKMLALVNHKTQDSLFAALDTQGHIKIAGIAEDSLGLRFLKYSLMGFYTDALRNQGRLQGILRLSDLKKREERVTDLIFTTFEKSTGSNNPDSIIMPLSEKAADFLKTNPLENLGSTSFPTDEKLQELTSMHAIKNLLELNLDPNLVDPELVKRLSQFVEEYRKSVWKYIPQNLRISDWLPEGKGFNSQINFHTININRVDIPISFHRSGSENEIGFDFILSATPNVQVQVLGSIQPDGKIGFQLNGDSDEKLSAICHLSTEKEILDSYIRLLRNGKRIRESSELRKDIRHGTSEHFALLSELATLQNKVASGIERADMDGLHQGMENEDSQTSMLSQSPEDNAVSFEKYKQGVAGISPEELLPLLDEESLSKQRRLWINIAPRHKNSSWIKEGEAFHSKQFESGTIEGFKKTGVTLVEFTRCIEDQGKISFTMLLDDYRLTGTINPDSSISLDGVVDDNSPFFKQLNGVVIESYFVMLTEQKKEFYTPSLAKFIHNSKQRLKKAYEDNRAGKTDQALDAQEEIPSVEVRPAAPEESQTSIISNEQKKEFKTRKRVVRGEAGKTLDQFLDQLQF